MLRVYFDEQTSFRKHVTQICSKLARATGLLYKLRHHVNNIWATRLYYTYCLPHSTYCCSIWSTCSRNTLEQVDIAQHKAVKTVHRLPFQTLSVDLYRNYKILDTIAIGNMQDVMLSIKYSRTMQMKLKTDSTHIFIIGIKLFPEQVKIHQIFISKPCNLLQHNVLLCTGLCLWNNLPAEV